MKEISIRLAHPPRSTQAGAHQRVGNAQEDSTDVGTPLAWGKSDSRFLIVLSTIAFCLALPAHAQDTGYALPDPVATPGAIDVNVGLDTICNGTTKHRRHVSPATRAKVLAYYGVSDMQSVGMEVDHLIPLSIGGSNAAENLWPQASPDYVFKDQLEVEP